MQVAQCARAGSWHTELGPATVPGEAVSDLVGELNAPGMVHENTRSILVAIPGEGAAAEPALLEDAAELTVDVVAAIASVLFADWTAELAASRTMISRPAVQHVGIDGVGLGRAASNIYNHRPVWVVLDVDPLAVAASRVPLMDIGGQIAKPAVTATA